MSRLLPTGSKLELAETCIASAVLEGHETRNVYSEQGKAEHAFLYDVLTTGDRSGAISRVHDKYRTRCADYDLDKLPAGQPGRWAGEVTFALDIETGRCRELGRGLGRKYAEAGLAPAEIAGTIDLVGVSDDAMILPDYKGGWKSVTPAKDNLQLGLAAVAATEVYQKEKAVVAIIYTAQAEAPRTDSAELGLFELQEMKDRIVALGRAVIEARRLYEHGDPKTGEVKKPRMVAGEHCERCPAILTCPAQGALVRRFIATPEETEADFKAGLSDNEKASHAFRRLVAAKAAVEKALAIVYARATQTPIALGDGTMLGPVETMRDSLDAKVVADVVKELYGEQAAKDAVELSTSKEAIKRMSRALKETGGGTISERERAVLEEVSRRGGLVSNPSVTVKVHKLKLPEGATS